eukprot:13698332-Ditylum_brightwellii.AAC.1
MPDSSARYRSCISDDPGVVAVACTLCRFGIAPSITHAAALQSSLYDPSLTAIASLFLIASAM